MTMEITIKLTDEQIHEIVKKVTEAALSSTISEVKEEEPEETEPEIKKYNKKITDDEIDDVRYLVEQEGKNLSEVCREKGLNYRTVYDRIKRPERADKKKVE